jgi:hypothetical protein
MALLYLFYADAMIVAFRGNIKLSLILFTIAIILSIFLFKYHVTDSINISL